MTKLSRAERKVQLETIGKGGHASGHTPPRNWRRNLRKAHKAQRDK